MSKDHSPLPANLVEQIINDNASNERTWLESGKSMFNFASVISELAEEDPDNQQYKQLLEMIMTYNALIIASQMTQN